MKVYINEFDLAKPSPRQFKVPAYSSFAIGVKVVADGVPFEGDFALEADGQTLTPEAGKIDGYAIYDVSSQGAGSTKYRVSCGGQYFELTQITTEAAVIEVEKSGGGSSEKYGISLDSLLGDVDANGVLQAPTNTSLEFVSDEIQSIQSAASLSFLKGSKQLTKIDLPNLTTVGD